MRKEFFIYVNNKKIEVTPEVYYAYWQSIRQERHLREYWRYKSISLDYLMEQQMPQTEFSLIEESVEDKAVKNYMIQQMMQGVEQLEYKEAQLIYALFFLGMTEREYAAKIGISQQTVNRKKQRILKKLKNFMKLGVSKCSENG